MNPLSAVLAQAGLSAEPAEIVAGGDTSEVWKVGRWLVKVGQQVPQGLFAAEARGLAALGEGGVRVPRVHWVGEPGIVMSWVEPGPADWVALAEQLAALHRIKGGWYGWEAPGFIGPIPLRPLRGTATDWVNDRIGGLLERTRPTLGDRLAAQVAAALQDPPAPEGPVLVHGDLWSGNFLMGRQGPVLIDPSTQYAERAVDLAMMRLFGGFPPRFWDAYAALSPLADNVERAIAFYQLYFLLVHVALFGQAYVAEVRRVVGQLQ